MSAVCALILVYPLDFWQTRVATDTKPKGTAPIPIKEIWAREGFRGVYRGFWFTATGIFAYRASFFGVFETGQVHLFTDMRQANPIYLFLYAQAVSIGASTLNYPYDTVRRRLMMQSGRSRSALQYSGALDCVAKVAREEGLRGFYRGFVPYLVRSSGSVVLIALHPLLKQRLPAFGECAN
jgi:solute carrier family 25 (adenine nucleotide translocator) protein 4/5/6/31